MAAQPTTWQLLSASWRRVKPAHGLLEWFVSNRLCLRPDVPFRSSYRQSDSEPFRTGFALRGTVDVVSRRTTRLM